MKVDQELIKKVAENARLNLSKKELDEFLPQFKEIIENFSKLDNLDTKNIKPSFQPIELNNVFRDDISKKSLTQEEALRNTKHKKDGYFKGPRII
ncbi:Asp-tRNA(Asn)/Glu-tRNA(Gln) amidotransferase subunit GatC [Candidatus Woesearchaeota archaeon]|nr:Asp-tRNA(Asn)/Glu-tRNA(Gln) amidotransferase subunit GatC [Candidatus Woesearchaeota archaeon]